MGSAGVTRPGKLWSLWDIMKPFDAALFMRFMESVGMTRTLEALPSLLKRAVSLNDVSDGWVTDWLILMDLYEQPCVELDLAASAATIRKLRAALKKPNPLSTDVNPLTIELGGRLYDEMGGRHFWALTISETAYYRNPHKGWEEAIAKFPASITDVEEASKCFALSRYAAAVFHSLQIVEIGLIDLGRVIVATDPQTGWNATTNRLNKILATKYPDRTPFQQQHSQFLEQISATIEALKSAWRNKISHAHDKLVLLTSDFTPEVAEEILLASRSFSSSSGWAPQSFSSPTISGWWRRSPNASW
jgi:hypothetical protein